MTSPTSRAITILNEIRALTANTHSGWALPQTLSALQQAHTLTHHALHALEGEQEEYELMPDPIEHPRPNPTSIRHALLDATPGGTE